MKFNESKFYLNQPLKILNTVLMLLFELVRFELDSTMLASSANRIGTDLSLRNFGKLFIKISKGKGPKSELWGTPRSTLAQADVVILWF